jgi:N-formylglutamate deformylase
LDDAALDSELLRMTDAYTDELFPLTSVEAARLVFPISRLVCDVERFPTDENEPMAAHGMGAIYMRTSKGDVLRSQPDAAYRQTLLDRWYMPHHAGLERKVNDVIARLGVCLIVDCHSFSSIPLPHEPDQKADRTDFCVGTDPFHTPAAIRDAIVAATEDEGYSIGIDAPFAGALVPLRSYHKDRRILSAMIEVNRRLYMDEQFGVKVAGFAKVQATLGRIIERAADVAAREAATLDGSIG